MVPKIAEVCAICNIPGPTQEENEKSNGDPSNATFSYEAPSLHKAEKPYTPPIPFPGRLAKSKQDKKLPPKLKDPGSFSINITIGGKLVEKAMLDLGASINLMPYSVYLQLVLDMEEAPIHDRELPILLGRPFMATAKTIIDVQNGLLTMTVLGETVQFKVFESLSHPSSSFDCCSIDVLDSLVFSKSAHRDSGCLGSLKTLSLHILASYRAIRTIHTSDPFCC
ncbi:unnamed protein product [Prunus brigantina]